MGLSPSASAIPSRAAARRAAAHAAPNASSLSRMDGGGAVSAVVMCRLPSFSDPRVVTVGRSAQTRGPGRQTGVALEDVVLAGVRVDDVRRGVALQLVVADPVP